MRIQKIIEPRQVFVVIGALLLFTFGGAQASTCSWPFLNLSALSPEAQQYARQNIDPLLVQSSEPTVLQIRAWAEKQSRELLQADFIDYEKNGREALIPDYDARKIFGDLAEQELLAEIPRRFWASDRVRSDIEYQPGATARSDVLHLMKLLSQRPGRYYFFGPEMLPYYQSIRPAIGDHAVSRRFQYVPMSLKFFEQDDWQRSRRQLRKILEKYQIGPKFGANQIFIAPERSFSSGKPSNLKVLQTEMSQWHGDLTPPSESFSGGWREGLAHLTKMAQRTAKYSLVAIPESEFSIREAQQLTGETGAPAFRPSIMITADRFPRWDHPLSGSVADGAWINRVSRLSPEGQIQALKNLVKIRRFYLALYAGVHRFGQQLGRDGNYNVDTILRDWR